MESHRSSSLIRVGLLATVAGAVVAAVVLVAGMVEVSAVVVLVAAMEEASAVVDSEAAAADLEVRRAEASQALEWVAAEEGSILEDRLVAVKTRTLPVQDTASLPSDVPLPGSPSILDAPYERQIRQFAQELRRTLDQTESHQLRVRREHFRNVD